MYADKVLQEGLWRIYKTSLPYFHLGVSHSYIKKIYSQEVPSEIKSKSPLYSKQFLI